MVIPASTEENAAEPVALSEIERPVQLNDFVPGLRFREVMTGMITKGCTDPGEGYADPAAVAMTLRATVTIDCLPTFLRDPNHRATWEAGGDIPVWDGRITPAADGDFELFRRTIGPNRKALRQMVYDTEITLAGQTYLFQGRKVIEPGPPWRVWYATTTLYVKFFKRDDPSGQPVAAGILRLSPVGFIRQLTTMRVVGRFGLYDKLHYLGMFMRFFAGSLVRTYVFRRRW
jgi:cholesterol oxidase